MFCIYSLLFFNAQLIDNHKLNWNMLFAIQRPSSDPFVSVFHVVQSSCLCKLRNFLLVKNVGNSLDWFYISTEPTLITPKLDALNQSHMYISILDWIGNYCFNFCKYKNVFILTF